MTKNIYAIPYTTPNFILDQKSWKKKLAKGCHSRVEVCQFAVLPELLEIYF